MSIWLVTFATDYDCLCVADATENQQSVFGNMEINPENFQSRVLLQ